MKRTLSILTILLSVMSSRAAQPSLFEALNTTNLTWGICCVSVWLGQTEVSHDGIAAAKSWPISDNQEVYLYTTLTGPGTVAFWWKVSSELDCDFLEFSIGGIPQSNISGEQDWQRLAFRVPAGSQELRWTYRKDAYVSWMRDCGWVDEVAFVPDSGPPVILAQPASQTVVAGSPATFVVGAGGGVPRTYRWSFNVTNVIGGATTATFTLPSATLASAGNYSVVVSNTSGSVTSSPALLTVTTNRILLFDDGPFSSPYYTALANMGWPYQRVTTDTDFIMALASANLANTVVVVDSTWNAFTSSFLVNFVNAGGRVLLQYWNLGADGSLAAACKITVAQTINTPLPLYDWGGSPFFAGLSSPLDLTETSYTSDGQKLQPAAGGLAVGGFTGAATPNQAALVIGNSGRTIVNGFVLENGNPGRDAARLARNEIEFLLALGIPRPPSIITQPHHQYLSLNGTATFAANAWGNPPLSYQWRFKGMNLAGATNSVLVLTNVTAGQAGIYSVVVTNASGATISSNATLMVFAPGEQFCANFGSGVPAGMTLFGNASVDQGYLKLTPTINGQFGVAYINDFCSGRPINTFRATFKAMLFAGSAVPGDGCSFNLVPAAGLNPSPGYANYEEGLDTGLVVNFDIWDNGGVEAPAIEVKWQGNVVGRALFQPSQGPSVTDPAVAARDVVILLYPDGTMDVSYGTTVIFSRLQTPYTPLSDVRWVIAARTGGGNENHWIDDLCILTPAALPPISELPGRAITTPGGVPTFKFTPPAGYKYRMVRKNELTDATWTPLGGWSPTSTGAEMTLTDTTAGGQPHRFYRLEAANP